MQSRVQELERKSVRTPQDDAELAQLQTKQQQILASGRPVAVASTTVSNNTVVSSTATSIPVSVQQVRP